MRCSPLTCTKFQCSPQLFFGYRRRRCRWGFQLVLWLVVRGCVTIEWRLLFFSFILQHTNLLSSCFIIDSPINRFSQRGGCISRGSETTIATTTTAIGGDNWPRAFCAAIGLLQFHRTLPRQFCGRTGTTQLVWCRSSHHRQQTSCVALCYASLWLSRFIVVCVTLLFGCFCW
jgi:hypothetical protein